jgi:hypothetical protein
MRLTRIYVRFYKSFNYDYERKFARTSVADPWELLSDAWYPYVRMQVEPSVTTIVGANEAGKSHLLDAIEKLITGAGIDRSDFCRYSHFFSVEQGKRRSPDFGGEFEVVDQEDVNLAKQHLGLDVAIGEHFRLFRPNGEAPIIYRTGQAEPIAVEAGQSALGLVLPPVFRLDAENPLPASIPLYELAPDAKRPYGSRRSRRAIFEGFLSKAWSKVDEVTKAAPHLFDLLSGFSASEAVDEIDKQYELGRALLFRVANIDPTIFKDLSDALADEREGYVNGVIQKINGALATHLNFPRWWAQDREFRLLVSPREHELVFTIRDRTGTDYSFAERSSGLRFFLSYYVQLLAHRPPATGQSEILLMDEPDAFLSSQGQQDLLRILEEFAVPESGSRHDQVVYVTHSPFLINRNAGERIRVLDKGVTDEGTRVVKDIARNHYEPLRSSLGAFVAETSFIGGSNLFVEGLADQVLLAGTSSHLLTQGAPKTESLDLNSVTIVPAGSASSVPYLVYLARGRDVVRPPCVALLDSDRDGNEAVKTLARGGARGKQILSSAFVVQVGSWANTVAERLSISGGVRVTEIEDLISVAVAVAAARNYAVKLVDLPRNQAGALVDADVVAKLDGHSGSLFDALETAFTERFGPDAHIEKVGFAKEVVAVLAESRALNTRPSGFEETEGNFRLLLAELAKLLRRADREEQDRRLNNRLERTIDGSLADYPNPTSRERGRLLVEEIQASVGDSEEGERLRFLADKLRREFTLDEDLTKPIDRYGEFQERIEALRYDERLAKQDPKVVVGTMEPEEKAKDAAPTDAIPAGSTTGTPPNGECPA